MPSLQSKQLWKIFKIKRTWQFCIRLCSINQFQVFAAAGNETFGALSATPLIKNWDNNDPRKVWTLHNKAVVNGTKVVINVAPPNDMLYGKFRNPLAPSETTAGNDFFYTAMQTFC
jgi:hypothetical protein